MFFSEFFYFFHFLIFCFSFFVVFFWPECRYTFYKFHLRWIFQVDISLPIIFIIFALLEIFHGVFLYYWHFFPCGTTIFSIFKLNTYKLCKNEKIVDWNNTYESTYKSGNFPNWNIVSPFDILKNWIVKNRENLMEKKWKNCWLK